MSSSNGHIIRQRDVSHERAFTIAAASLIERSPMPIITFAEQRAPLTPLRDFLVRDFALDGLEELADARNYIAWDALRLDLASRPEPEARAAREAMQCALAHVVEAFAQITLARALNGSLEAGGREE